MSAIQPRGFNSGNEELGAISIGASIGHRENTRTGVLQHEILISKLLAVDGLASSAIVICEVTSLQHEVGDDTVEGGPLVAETLLPSTQGTEVFACLRGDI